MEELVDGALKIITRDISLVSLLNLGMTSKRMNQFVKSELASGWALSSLGRFIEPKLGGVSFKSFCAWLKKHNVVLSGSTLLQWALGEDYDSDLDLFCAHQSREEFRSSSSCAIDAPKFFGTAEYFDEKSRHSAEYAKWTSSTKGITKWEFYVDTFQNKIQLIHHVRETGIEDDLAYKGLARDSLILGNEPHNLTSLIITGIVVHTFDLEMLKNVFDGSSIYFHHFSDVANRRMTLSLNRLFTPESRLLKYYNRGFGSRWLPNKK